MDPAATGPLAAQGPQERDHLFRLLPTRERIHREELRHFGVGPDLKEGGGVREPEFPQKKPFGAQFGKTRDVRWFVGSIGIFHASILVLCRGYWQRYFRPVREPLQKTPFGVVFCSW